MGVVDGVGRNLISMVSEIKPQLSSPSSSLQKRRSSTYPLSSGHRSLLSKVCIDEPLAFRKKNDFTILPQDRREIKDL